MTTSNDLHVVFGTGAIGLALIEDLRADGKSVRAVNRSGRADVPEDVEVLAGDAADSDFTTKAAAGADVIYFCVNPPYTRWPELFPPMQAAVLAGAEASGAKLVALENLYMYGPVDGRTLTEDLPYAAKTRKGSTRAQMSNDLMAAHSAGRARIAIGRASDYFGPHGTLSAMGERVFYPAIAGKKAQVIGDADQPHTYTYIPDIARGLAILGEHDDADGDAWHLPSPPALTTRAFIEMVFAAAGTDAGISAMPRFMVNLVGLFNGNVRELKEMLYEFEQPFVVDHSQFAGKFGDIATPLEEAIEGTIAWYRANPRK